MQSIQSTFPALAANAALVLIGVACALLDRQIASLASAFEEEGGFTERLHRVRSERLTAKRIEARDKQQAAGTPECPQCGKPMRRRKSAKGEFWGCAAFPDCKGTRPA